MKLGAAPFAVGWLLLLTGNLVAQLPQVSDKRLGVDRVRMEGGKRLYGFVLAENPDRSITLAVERVWLETTYPSLFEKEVEREKIRAQAARDELLSRIETWIQQREQDELLIRFLRSESQRIDATEASQRPTAPLLSIHLPKEEIRDVFLQPPDRRKIAGLAFQHGLHGMTVTPASILRRKLLQQGVDLDAEQVDLSGSMPATEKQSLRQWSARKALVEFHRREALEYQGTGTNLIRKGEQTDLAALIGQFLGGGGLDAIGQLGAELGLPEFKKPSSSSDWWRKATREAERDGFRGVLLTRLNQSLLSPEVIVTSHFFAQEAPGKWFLVAEFRAASNANSQPAERIARLKEDPQIKSLLGTLDGLGISAGDRLDQALRHGAATGQALEKATSQFYTFLGPQIRALDGPPVPVQETR